jgi:hypothetical protein
MKVIRAHDYPADRPEPDFKGLRRLLLGLFIAQALFFLACAVFTIRPVLKPPCKCLCR